MPVIRTEATRWTCPACQDSHPKDPVTLPLPYGGTNATTHHWHAPRLAEPPAYVNHMEVIYRLIATTDTPEQAEAIITAHAATLAPAPTPCPDCLTIRTTNNRIGVYVRVEVTPLYPNNGHRVTEYHYHPPTQQEESDDDYQR